MNDKEMNIHVVYDLETGGLDYKKNPIIEMAFIVLLRDKRGKLYIDEGMSFESLILPYNSDLIIEDKALQANKITLKEIKKYGNDAENIKEVLIELVNTLNPKKNDRFKPILVGHNIHRFDNKFFEKFLKDIGAPDLYNMFDESSIDTFRMCKSFLEGQGMINSFSLGNLCEFFGVKMNDKHRAFEDALANAKLFIKLSEMFKINRKELLKMKGEESNDKRKK